MDNITDDTASTEQATSTAVEEWLRSAMSAESTDVAARNLILSAAERCCTKKQRSALVHLLDGRSTVEIGRLMGIAQSTVWRHLYGDPRPGHRGGAVVLLRQALKQEAQLVRDVLDEVGAESDEPTAKEAIVAWFAGLTPLRLRMFGPLAVLLVAHFVADARRSVSVGDLYLYVPKPIVTAALSELKATGYVAYDGITVTIRKTPLDELRKEKK